MRCPITSSVTQTAPFSMTAKCALITASSTSSKECGSTSREYNEKDSANAGTVVTTRLERSNCSRSNDSTDWTSLTTTALPPIPVNVSMYSLTGFDVAPLKTPRSGRGTADGWFFNTSARILSRLVITGYLLLFAMFLRCHSAKDCRGASGISRSLYHGLSRLLMANGTFLRNHLPALPATRNNDGDAMVSAIAFIATAFDFGAYPSLTITCRHL